VSALDLGEITPAATTGPLRDTATTLDRLTTTEEQRAEVLDVLTTAANDRRVDAVKVLVRWPEIEPTILEARFLVEHLNGQVIRTLDDWFEALPTGEPIPRNEAERVRILTDEINELRAAGMLGDGPRL
jgi:hypothetical protein